MAKQTYKILGQLGFNKYDELLRDKIKHGDEFVPTEQIDELFPGSIDSSRILSIEESENNG